jgi:hypothetical protein
MRKSIIILTAIFALVLFSNSATITHAETPLPPSDWYAVIWNRSDDTLHWVNNATELASIPRPQMPGETAGADLYISPNGRWMMMTALLENQQQGLGFYDLQSGEWLQIHAAQPGESIIAAERNPFSRNSDYAAIGLHSDTGWRVITFETATGNATATLTRDHPDIPAEYIPSQAVPRVTLYSLDEALAQWRVHIRFVTLGPHQSTTPQPSLGWYPEQGIVYPDSFDPSLLDLDILPIQNRILYSQRDGNAPTQTRIYGQTLGHEGEVVYEQGGAFIVQPRWVAGGQFVAFRLTQGAQVPMWYLGGFGSDDLIPFAPDYDELLGTSDGFVLVDYEGGEVKFANTLAFEAYTPTVGNVIYTTDTSNFHIVYLTPMGLDFTLTTLATPSDTPPVVGGEDVVQAPQTATTMPVGAGDSIPPSRVEVGGQFRVISPVGVRLGQDDYVFPPEGTIGTILAPADPGFWQVEIAHEGSTVIGTLPEGAYETHMGVVSAHYFIEPFITCLPFPLDANAVNSPNGIRVRVLQANGLPVASTPGGAAAWTANAGEIVRIFGEPACSGGLWYVQAQNFQQQSGWMRVQDDNGFSVLEPVTMAEADLEVLNPTPPQPTQIPPVVQVPPTATNPPHVDASGDGNCSNAPVGAELTIGEFATTSLGVGNTLAMRANLHDEFPMFNIPDGRVVRVLNGPVCNAGFRMWYVVLTQNDGEIAGWVADGFGNNRYLHPGPASGD